MTPPGNGRLTDPLQNQRHGTVQDGEDQVSRQRHVKPAGSQVAPCPNSEKDERGHTRRAAQPNEPPILQKNNGEQSDIGEELIRKEKRRAMRDARIHKKEKAPEHGDATHGDGRSQQSPRGLAGALGPEQCSQEQRFEPKKNTHRNESLASQIVKFVFEKAPDPPHLHQDRASGAEDRQGGPVLAPRHHEETGVEQRDVSKQTERIILPAR